jgi:hypothetical protein
MTALYRLAKSQMPGRLRESLPGRSNAPDENSGSGRSEEEAGEEHGISDS